jgi:methylated-DNA-[protein]-cysteine S-methyltransferase
VAKLAIVNVKSAIGTWSIEGNDDGVFNVHMPRDAKRATSGIIALPLSDAAKQLTEYFARKRKNFDVQLTGANPTDFQADVWDAIEAIPYGDCWSYGDIALAVNRPRASRAVGNANHANPWPVFIPCHRVVATNGIGGYGGGLDVKEFLLKLEGVDLTTLR